MLHNPPFSLHRDPFCFPSSSPERHVSPSYVATRTNPYSAKSQDTPYYSTLRTTAQLGQIDPRLCGSALSTDSFKVQLGSADALYSSLEAASRSPRCSSKPETDKRMPLPTMVKSKSRPVRALALSAELAAVKRLSHLKVETAAANKRRKSLAEAAKQHSKSDSTAGNSASVKVPTRASPTNTEKAAFIVPKITIRSPTPEPEPSTQHLHEGEVDYAAFRADKGTPLQSNALLTDLKADMSKIEDGIDDILSKYLDLRRYPPSICNELLRYLASSLGRLYCCVTEPESDMGLARIRAIGSHFFKHVVTGFIHLLEDQKAPYGTASCLALASANLSEEMDDTVDWCTRALNGPTRAQCNFNHGALFVNVLNAELAEILQRGLDMAGTDSSLTLPAEMTSKQREAKEKSIRDSEDAAARPGSSDWMDQRKEQKQWAQEGHELDMFTNINVVTYVGELVAHGVIEARVLTRWLDRFLVHTVFLGVPSNWEIECACALLVTVGAVLEQDYADDTSQSEAELHASASRGDSLVSPMPSLGSKDDTTHDASPVGVESDVLNRAMDRVQRLIDHGEISDMAREWLVLLQQLRERGWKHRAVHSDSYDVSSSD